MIFLFVSWGLSSMFYDCLMLLEQHHFICGESECSESLVHYVVRDILKIIVFAMFQKLLHYNTFFIAILRGRNCCALKYDIELTTTVLNTLIL